MTAAVAACILCGKDGLIPGDRRERGLLDSDLVELRMLLVEWREPVLVDGHRVLWSTLPRCVDRLACRARLTASGEPWPVREAGEPVGRPQPPKLDVGQREPASAEAMHSEPANAADADADLAAVFG